MSLLSFIKSIRKIQIFIVTFFPGLLRVTAPIRSKAAKVRANPRLQATLGRLEKSKAGRAGRQVLRQYFWEDYSKYTADRSKLDPAALPILRPVFALAIILCATIPLAIQFPYPSVPQGAIEGVKGPVAAWAVALWLISAAIAWSCLLVGCLLTNRGALIIALIFFLYFIGAEVGGFHRSSWNAILPIIALVATMAGERTARNRDKGGCWASFLYCLAGGMLAGVAAFAMTPLARYASGHVIRTGMLWGTGAGVLLFVGSIRPWNWTDRKNAAVYWFHAFVALLAVHQLSIAARAGWGGAASAVVSFFTLWSGYLWPLYYFIGAGVIYKVLGRAGEIVELMRSYLPGKLFAVLLLAGLIIAFAAAWLPLVLDTLALPWPSWLVRAAEISYERTAGLIWNDPIRATTAEWVRWVLLFDVAAVLWLAIARRVDTKILGAFFYATLVATFLVQEYMYQFGGFLRAPTHSAAVLGLYAAGILWLVHRTALKFTINSTPRWPALGRAGIYGALLILVLLCLNARGAIHDNRLMTEFFFYFFSGLVGIGIPYYLYVFATRTFGKLPVSLPRLFGCFCAGAALTLPAAALDRFVVAGGSLSALQRALDIEKDLMLVSGKISAEVPLMPTFWLVLRGTLFLSALFLTVYLGVRRRSGIGRSLEWIFLSVAVATGFASFSGIKIDLPLVPLKAAILTTPYQKFLSLDLNLIVSHLEWGLPALVLGLTFAHTAVPAKRWFAAALAAGLHFSLSLAWPAHEAWVRSAGLIPTAGIALVLLYVALVYFARFRVKAMIDGHSAGGETAALPDSRPYFAPAGLKAVMISSLVLLTGAAAVGIYKHRGIERAVPGLVRLVPVPAVWNPEPAAGAALRFRRPSLQPHRPMLMIDAGAEATSTSPEQIVDDFAKAASAGLPGFAALRRERWDRHYKGSSVLEFEYERKLPDGTILQLVGTKMVLPLPDKHLLDVTLTAVFTDWLDQRWDLQCIAQEMARRTP